MRRLLSLLLVVPLLPAAGASAQTTECDGNFHLVHSLGALEMSDVDFAGTEGWAVGFDYEHEASGDLENNERPLVVRFDENDVEKITPPRDPERRYELQGVAAVASNDVHAVGHSYRGGTTDAVAFHWDGMTWTQLEVPSPGKRTYLRAVSASGVDDVWAVGDYVRRGSGGATLVLHFDGVQWSRVPSPEPGEYASLWDIDVLSPTEAWAVGGFAPRHSERPLALRWNGTEWQRRRFNGLDFPGNQRLFGVDALSSEDIWAVGDGALALHRDANGWSFTEVPEKRGGETLNEVAATSSHAWTVGSRFVLRPYETVKPLAALFMDGAWQHVTYEGERYGGFEAVTLDDAGNAWTVGETFDPDGPDQGDVIEKACLP